jgi:TIR domain
MADIFLSYAREDEPAARALSVALRDIGSVFLDRQLVPGQSWDTTLEHELSTATCVVVLWSTFSVASQWVRSEAAVAQERGVLVPAVLDDIEPPLPFRLVHNADLRAWSGDPNHEGFLALRLGIIQCVTHRTAQPQSRPVYVPVRQATSLQFTLVLSASVVAAVFLAGFVTSGVHDLGLHAEGVFASSIGSWFALGLRSFVQPVVFAALLGSAGIFVMSVDARLGSPLRLESAARAVANRAHDAPASRLGLNLSLAHGASVVGCVLIYRHLLAAIYAFITGASPTMYRLLAPDWSALQESYRVIWSIVVFAFGAAWAWLVWRQVRSGRLRDIGQRLVGGVLMCALSVCLWALPYRILSHSDYPRVRYESATCYVVAEANGRQLLFCPLLPQAQRFPTVASHNEGLSACNIFTELAPSAECDNLRATSQRTN